MPSSKPNSSSLRRVYATARAVDIDAGPAMTPGLREPLMITQSETADLQHPCLARPIGTRVAIPR